MITETKDFLKNEEVFISILKWRPYIKYSTLFSYVEIFIRKFHPSILQMNISFNEMDRNSFLLDSAVYIWTLSYIFDSWNPLALTYSGFVNARFTSVINYTHSINKKNFTHTNFGINEVSLAFIYNISSSGTSSKG